MWNQTTDERELRRLREDADYYQRQADERRREVERLREEQHEREKARREENRRAYEEASRQADSWPDALRKQIYLMQREITSFPHEETEQWWQDNIDACRRALELWEAVGREYAAEIERLEQKIRDIGLTWRISVGIHLAMEKPGNNGWQIVANTLRDEDETPEHFLDW